MDDAVRHREAEDEARTVADSNGRGAAWSKEGGKGENVRHTQREADKEEVGERGAGRDGGDGGGKRARDTAQRATAARTEAFRAKAIQKRPRLKRVEPDSNLSLRAIAQKLTDMGVPTITGKQVWSANGVRRLKLLALEIRERRGA